MNKYLPSKKFSFTLLSIIIALGIIYGFSWLLNKQKNITTKQVEIENKAKVQEFMALDTDGDGMKDWEEALWKTDPNKTDTDGDGTIDSEEITLNRDPLKQNINPANQEPSDKISEEIIEGNKRVEEEFNKLTATEKMGRTLFSQYIATKKIDYDLTETEKLQIVENTISDLPDITFKNYSVTDLLLNDRADNETLKIYSNTTARIIIENLKTETENIEDIITDFSNLTDNKTNEQIIAIFKRFDPLVNKNKKTIEDLLQINVPKILLTEHLNLLNAFQEIYESLDLMQKSATDTVMLIPLLNNYDNLIQNLADALSVINKKLISLKVDYSSTNDYGYQLFNVIIFK